MGLHLQANSKPVVLISSLSLCKQWHLLLAVSLQVVAGSWFTVSTIVLGMKDGPLGKLNLSFLLQRANSPFPSQNNMTSILPGKAGSFSVLFFNQHNGQFGPITTLGQSFCNSSQGDTVINFCIFFGFLWTYSVEGKCLMLLLLQSQKLLESVKSNTSSNFGPCSWTSI